MTASVGAANHQFVIHTAASVGFLKPILKKAKMRGFVSRRDVQNLAGDKKCI